MKAGSVLITGVFMMNSGALHAQEAVIDSLDSTGALVAAGRKDQIPGEL